MGNTERADADMPAFAYRAVSAIRHRSYRVSLSPGLSAGKVSELVDAISGRKCLLVTTPSVAGLYANTIASRLLASGADLNMLVIECSEQSKSLSEVEKLCNECFRAGLDRKSVLIGCGGGVCTDLVTMAAALTRRGLSHIKIPTTLIGLIDAGIGIKGAVNLPGKKSGIGCFYPPDHVLLDPLFLRTLPRRLLSDGLAEAIKVAITFDSGLFELIEKNSYELLNNPQDVHYDRAAELVWRSSNLLLDELETNLYEDQTYERFLDFGHTFSPMIEAESGFHISHGMSVAIDMALSSAIGYYLGLLSHTDQQRIFSLLQRAGLPRSSNLLTFELCCRAISEIEAHRGGHLNLTVPTGIGRAIFLSNRKELPNSALSSALRLLERETQEDNIALSNAPLMSPPPVEAPKELAPGRPAAFD